MNVGLEALDSIVYANESSRLHFYHESLLASAIRRVYRFFISGEGLTLG
jgi:hypothetical protein